MRHEPLIGYDCTASSVKTIILHFRSRYLLRRLLILRSIEGTWGIRPFGNSDTSLSFWNKCSGVYYWVSVLWSTTAKRDSHSCSVKQCDFYLHLMSLAAICFPPCKQSAQINLWDPKWREPPIIQCKWNGVYFTAFPVHEHFVLWQFRIKWLQVAFQVLEWKLTDQILSC